MGKCWILVGLIGVATGEKHNKLHLGCYCSIVLIKLSEIMQQLHLSSPMIEFCCSAQLSEMRTGQQSSYLLTWNVWWLPTFGGGYQNVGGHQHFLALFHRGKDEKPNLPHF